MATHNSPALLWVRYCPQTMLLDTATMSLPAEVAHRRLADFALSSKPWLAPDSDAFLSVTRLTKENLSGVIVELKSAGWRIRNKMLWNSALNAEMINSTAMRDAGAMKAANAAHRRWHATPATATQQRPAPPVDLDAQALLKQCSSSAPSIAQAMLQTCTDKPINRPTDLPTSVAVNSELLTVNQAVAAASPLSGSSPLQGKDSKTTKGLEEGTFLAELFAALKSYNPAQAKAEMTNWGGWWRVAYRTNPDKSRRVLADLSNMISERRINSNPGAAAADLWKRLPD